MTEPTATGTIYGLTDPRDGQVRYIGQTVRTLQVRLGGHTGGKTSPKMRAWIADLRTAGLKPGIVAIREGVPVAGLRGAETEEITRIIVAGGALLNEVQTGRGLELNRLRSEAERAEAKRAAWAQLGTVALALLGGPLPPGELPEVEIPDLAWEYMTKAGPDRRRYMDSLVGREQPEDTADERYRLHRALIREQETAAERLWRRAQGAWGEVRSMGGDSFDRHIERCVRLIADTPSHSRADASRLLALAAWYVVAVGPWRHLAKLGGLPPDDASFVAWAGRDPDVREALTFLAASDEGMLEKLSAPQHPYDAGPGHLLATITAAYSGTEPRSIRDEMTRVLEPLADDHMVTACMADLLMRLNPRAMDSVFGPDVAAAIDRDLNLPAGTSGAVIRALVEHLGASAGGARRVADRSAQTWQLASLPDYGTWSGPGVLAARIVSASLVRAGLGESKWMSGEAYLAEVRGLWTPQPMSQEEREDHRRAGEVAQFFATAYAGGPG